MDLNYFVFPGIDRPGIAHLKQKQIKKHCDQIFQTVCDHYGEDPETVKSNDKKRNRKLVEIRQLSMTLFMTELKLSQAKSGAYFGKDHATALHSKKTVDNLRNTDRIFKQKTDIFFKN